MKFDVKITEISIKHVTVEAEDQFRAEEIAEDKWNEPDNNPDYVLTYDDFVEAHFDATEIKEKSP